MTNSTTSHTIGKIHAADINKSVMLRRILEGMADGLFHSTREIANATGCCCVSSRIQELKANGYNVECAYSHTTEDRNRVYKYRLLPPTGDYNA